MNGEDGRGRDAVRVAVAAFVIASLAAIGASVTEVYAGGSGCFEFDCGEPDDPPCHEHECDICWTHNKCALIPQ